ncbi:hypothetical protein ABEB36_004517 [Hypothenemus hampei]|uniref:Ig-like domain-containing protein n=1 Tax=Hypothenemus hampei TaxID=57062 RepID=A0ABD1F7B0_HYPHA
MRGINGDARVPYNFKFDFTLVCFLVCITFTPRDVLGYQKSSVTPYFDEISARDFEVPEGQTVIIPCTVRNLSYEKVVSWIRSKDIHILTSGSLTFASDYRFEVVHSDSNNDFWGLRIRGVKVEDSGQYECQVNTEPKMSLAYKLTVSKIGTDENSKWLGYATIHEPKEVFVQNGSPYAIQCEISTTISKKISTEVWWLHEDTQILSQPIESSRITIHTSLSEQANIIHSILTFHYVTWQDAGTYTCLQPSVKKDNIKLVIVEAESSEAMQRDFPLASFSTKNYTAIVPIILTLHFSTRLYLALLF